MIEYHFGGVVRFMISLIQFSTFDSAAHIYTQIMFQNWFILPYFVSFMLVVGIALMNTLTAVIVEGSIEMTKSDKDVQQLLRAEMMKKFLPELKGSIGEGPNNSNFSDQSSVKILGIRRKPRKVISSK